MITGFNTDIEHDGVVYHVQTEDKGLDTPIILSLVYVGGAILASKRAPYEDLIAEGFSDEVLSERLKRQHKLICAAINSGRINDLKKMSGRAAEVQETQETVQAEIGPDVVPAQIEPEVQEVPAVQPIEVDARTEEVAVSEPEQPEAPESEFVFELEDIPSQVWSPPPKMEPPPPPPEPEITEPAELEPLHDEAYTVHDSRSHSQLREIAPDEGLVILLLDDTEFSSGEARTLRVLVANRKGDDEKPVGSANVSVKILGTAFRPLIYALKTDRDGVASIDAQIPHFNSGRAAVLIRAVVKDRAAELRRVIHPSQ